MKIFCLIQSSAKCLDRINRVKNTWAKDIPHLFYSDHEDIQQNIIKVSDCSDYICTDEKNVGVINLIRENYNNIIDLYDWIFFCDDDTFVDVKLLHEQVEYFNKLCVYGNMLSYETGPNNPIYQRSNIPISLIYPQGGSGYLVSTFLLKNCGKFTLFKTNYADVDVGLNLHYKKIQKIHCSLLNSEPPEFYKHDVKSILESITYHHIYTDEQMNYLYNLKTS